MPRSRQEVGLAEQEWWSVWRGADGLACSMEMAENMAWTEWGKELRLAGLWTGGGGISRVQCGPVQYEFWLRHPNGV